MNLSNFTALGVRGFPGVVEERHRLVGDMEGKRVRGSRGPAEELEGEGMDGDAPGMEPEPVAGAALGGERRREIAVLDDERALAVAGHDADALPRLALVHHLGGKLGVAEEVMAEELGVERHRERIVDLKRRHVPAAAVGEPCEAAGSHEGRQHAAVAIGRHGDVVGGIEEEVAIDIVDGRQIALPEDEDMIGVEAAVVVVGQPRPRVGVGRGAGHDRQRERTSVPPRDAAEPAEEEIEERRPGEHANGHDPLRAVASQPRTLSTGHEYGAEVTRLQSRPPGRRGLIGGVTAEAMAGGGGGAGEIGSQARGRAGHGSRPRRAGEAPELAEPFPIDRRELPCEPIPRAGFEDVPEPQKLILTGPGDRFPQRRREGSGVHGDLHSGAAPDPRPEEEGDERKADEDHTVGKEGCPEMLGPAGHGGWLPGWGEGRIVDRRERGSGDDIDRDQNRLVGRFIETAFNSHSPGEDLGCGDRRLDLLARGPHLHLGKLVKGWAEADMSRDEARAGDDGEMEGAAEALHPLIGEKIALETLLDDGRRRGGRIWRHVTCDRKRGLGDWGCGGGARRGGRPATNPIGSLAALLRRGKRFPFPAVPTCAVAAPGGRLRTPPQPRGDRRDHGDHRRRHCSCDRHQPQRTLVRSEEGRRTGKGRSEREGQPEADGQALQCLRCGTGADGRCVDQGDEGDTRDHCQNRREPRGVERHLHPSDHEQQRSGERRRGDGGAERRQQPWTGAVTHRSIRPGSTFCCDSHGRDQAFPAAFASSADRSVFSHGKPSRPKCPPAAVLR